MATFHLPIIGAGLSYDAGVFPDKVSNQITSGTLPSVGGVIGIVMNDGGADEGFYCSFRVPANYVGTAKITVNGILDGAPSNGHDLGFFFRKRAVADNESADGTFDAEEVCQDTDIGGTGEAYSDEDEYEAAITLTDAHYAANKKVYYYFGIDASGTTYPGNFIVTGLYFTYNDA